MQIALPAASWQPAATLPSGLLNFCLAASSADDGMLFAVGGYNFPPPDYKSSVVSLDTKDAAAQWSTSWPTMSTSRDSFGCGVLNGRLYAVGGESANYPFVLDSVERLDVSGDGHGGSSSSSSKNASWEMVAKLNQSRNGHAVAVVGGKLYAAGGMAGDATSTVLASVEAFDPTSNRWETLTSMSVRRCYMGLVGYRNSLYAIGGLSSSGAGGIKQAVASIERFDVDAGVWRMLAPLPEPRDKLAATATPLGIYVLGGCASKQCDTLLDSVLLFTPPTRSSTTRTIASNDKGNWTTAPSLPASNAWFGAASMGDALYAVGGGLFYGRNATYTLRV